MKRTIFYPLIITVIIIFVGAFFYSPAVNAASTPEKVTIKVAKKAKKKTVTAYVGDKIQLEIKSGSKTVKLNNATYKSSNTKLAKVSKKGLITVKKTGKTKITVTTKDKKTFTDTIMRRLYVL